MWLLLWVLCTLLALYFQGYIYPLAETGKVLHVISYSVSRVLSSHSKCCKRMPFIYLKRWLHYFSLIVLLKHTYVIKVVQYLFFFPDLACCILNVANKHGITLIPACICVHLNVEAKRNVPHIEE